MIHENSIRRDSGDVAGDAAHQRGAVAPKAFWSEFCVYKELITVKNATSLMMTMKSNSRTAKGLAICETARALTETSLKLEWLEQGVLKIMNVVILVNSAQMFFRNFGLRHVNAALGFAIGLAAPNANQKIIALIRETC
jgi:hypothetical protein